MVPGSSPLTRGKRWRAVRTRCACRLIPAHAGKTARQWTRLLRSWAHPRSRGENEKVTGERYPYPGSSPLMRGKPRRRASSSNGSRLIPAHAGKTAGERVLGGVHWAHPRSRGENRAGVHDPERAVGSSPLTRGKPPSMATSAGCAGLIPAHAGKTWRRGAGRPTRRAHPRSRGENRSTSSFSAGAAGSSPLTRGKLHLRAQQSRRDRLIPAHAGKTGPSVCAIFFAGAHPRSRGENLIRRDHRRVLRGSSPLTRGKRAH